VAAYKRGRERPRRWRRPGSWFEAVLRENPSYGILEGAEETRWMVWRPFATKPERVDTMEALDLLMLAPPLYSVFHQRSSAFISHPCGQTTEHTEHTERTGG